VRVQYAIGAISAIGGEGEVLKCVSSKMRKLGDGRGRERGESNRQPAIGNRQYASGSRQTAIGCR
jgi:hypothetical protein